MAFKTDYLTKYDQLNRFVKQQRDGATQGAGVGSRQRTQKMLALGEAQAEQTVSAMRTSAQGVRRIFNQSDVASSRGSELSPDLQTAAMMQAIQEDFEENKPEDEPVTDNKPLNIVDFDEGMIEFAMGALADVESRGSGDYKAVGPVVNKGMYKGERAYGKYQVMESNIGPWTEQFYGTRLTKNEFLANPEAQDAVVENQLMSNWQKHGSIEDAVSIWFTGRTVEKAKGASDQNMSAPEYLTKWTKNFIRRREEELGAN